MDRGISDSGSLTAGGIRWATGKCQDGIVLGVTRTVSSVPKGRPFVNTGRHANSKVIHVVWSTQHFEGFSPEQ